MYLKKHTFWLAAILAVLLLVLPSCGGESLEKFPNANEIHSENADNLGNDIEDNLEYSQGLVFKSNGDGTCYVADIGTFSDTTLIVPPRSPKGDKVVEIRDLLTTLYIEDRDAFRNIETVIIPEGVTIIGDFAFSQAKGLTNIQLPDSLTSIGEYAFQGCDSLETIIIPDSVENIDKGAFQNSEKLKKVVLPKNLDSIAVDQFRSCSSLEEITIPNSVICISRSAFYGCDKLEELTLPENLAIIQEFAFGQCDNLKTINIPGTVQTIESEAFGYCESLTSISFNGTKTQWNAVEKDEDWDDDTPSYTIHCTDGDIPKSES